MLEVETLLDSFSMFRDECDTDCNGPYICGEGKQKHVTTDNPEGGTAQRGTDAEGALHGCGEGAEGGCGENHQCIDNEDAEDAEEAASLDLADLERALTELSADDLMALARYDSRVEVNRQRRAIQVFGCKGKIGLHILLADQQTVGIQ